MKISAIKAQQPVVPKSHSKSNQNFKCRYLIDTTKINTGNQYSALMFKVLKKIQNPVKFVKYISKYGFNKAMYIDVASQGEGSMEDLLKFSNIPFVKLDKIKS